MSTPPQKQCKRLWCTSAEGDHKGCRTQHMPLADGTDCGHGMVCLLYYFIRNEVFDRAPYDRVIDVNCKSVQTHRSLNFLSYLVSGL